MTNTDSGDLSGGPGSSVEAGDAGDTDDTGGTGDIGDTGSSAEEALAAAERWFVRHGVPHFAENPYYVSGLPAFLRPFAAFIRLLRLAAMLGFWSVRRVFAEIREVGHLAVRALPLLALFGMVIFFTRDFWQIAAALASGWLWVTAAFFILLIQAFLVARLPDEFGTLPKACTPERIRASCAATPLAPLADAEGELTTDPALGLGQRRNMFLYLLLTQTIQISLLSWMVFFFYVVFGAIAIRPPVLKDWFGHVPADARLLGVQVPGVSSELLHVSVLLAGLSALYFAITALTDTVYRREFFDRTLAELDKAIHMRCAYLTVRSGGSGSGRS
ncbi:hypothetical protein [Catenulispora pinisilvae]|uniref:hypothetical protein n=1 Tax=Catenulispora pinisilvae TaxID=2705253 RepID=UPI001891A501|nr:hypothetical protein [Catenulispora pinisilvae]